MLAPSRRFPLFFAGFALMAGLACDDGTSPSPPTLETLWPDEEGRTWSYRASLHEWVPDHLDPNYVFASEDLVPAFPEWDTLITYYKEAPAPPAGETTAYSYSLRLEGSLTTPYGVTARNLMATMDGVDLVFCGSDTPLTAASPLLHALSRIEPRSRLAITRVLGQTEIESAPNFLIHGGAFEKTEDWVGNYGCVDTLLAWKFLGDDLKPGATFTLQLIPSLKNDLFLHARVYRQTRVTTPAGRFVNALEVLYSVDFGILAILGPADEIVGYERLILLGSVVYANGVGPVASYERTLLPVGTDGLGVGVGEISLSLESYGAPIP